MSEVDGLVGVCRNLDPANFFVQSRTLRHHGWSETCDTFSSSGERVSCDLFGSYVDDWYVMKSEDELSPSEPRLEPNPVSLYEMYGGRSWLQFTGIPFEDPGVYQYCSRLDPTLCTEWETLSVWEGVGQIPYFERDIPTAPWRSSPPRRPNGS